MRGSKIFLWLALLSAIQGISQTKKVAFGLECNHYQIGRKISEKTSTAVFDFYDGLYDSISEKRKVSMIFLNPYFQLTKNKFSHRIGISFIPQAFYSEKRDTFLSDIFLGRDLDKYHGSGLGGRLSPRIGISYGNELYITDKISFQWGLNLSFLYLGVSRNSSRSRFDLGVLPPNLNLGFSYSVTKSLKANLSANLTPYNFNNYSSTIDSFSVYYYNNTKNSKNISTSFSSKYPIQLSFGLNYIFSTKQGNKKNIQPDKTYQF
jgi:hypothetical protein